MSQSWPVVRRFPLLLVGLVALLAVACEERTVGGDKVGLVAQPLVIAGAKVPAAINSLANQHPWNKIGAMLATDGNCTCVKIINEQTCVTAAHCLIDCRTLIPSMPSTIVFAHGARAHSSTWGVDPRVHPYGWSIPVAWTKACAITNDSSQPQAVREQADNVRERTDIAVIRFRGPAIAASDTLHFGAASNLHYGPTAANVPDLLHDVGDPSGHNRYLDVADVAGRFRVPVIVAGYPDGTPRPPGPTLITKLLGVNLPYPQLVASSNGNVGFQPTNDPFRLAYAISTEGGMSGSPILLESRPGFYQVVGIHTGGRARSGAGYISAGVHLESLRTMWLYANAGR